MRVVIATVQIPFSQGGAEQHAVNLNKAIRQAGHECEIVSIPFKWYPPERILDCMLSCRLTDLTEINGTLIDRLIGLRFPAYLIHHPHKVLWILHQHRPAYDQWESGDSDLLHYSNGDQVRKAIFHADKKLISEAKAIYANSHNVRYRLEKYCGIQSVPLYHPPPDDELLYCAEPQDYLYYPSRIDRIKRQDLVMKALRYTKGIFRVIFSGCADNVQYLNSLKSMAVDYGIDDRIQWSGYVDDNTKRTLYAHSLGVLYPTKDEDYGYITLEAMLSSKPVITCTDSGGTLEFIKNGETGIVTEPEPKALAAAMDRLWEDRTKAKKLGLAGHDFYRSLNITWDRVVEKLLV